MLQMLVTDDVFYWEMFLDFSKKFAVVVDMTTVVRTCPHNANVYYCLGTTWSILMF